MEKKDGFVFKCIFVGVGRVWGVLPCPVSPGVGGQSRVWQAPGERTVGTKVNVPFVLHLTLHCKRCFTSGTFAEHI